MQIPGNSAKWALILISFWHKVPKRKEAKRTLEEANAGGNIRALWAPTLEDVTRGSPVGLQAVMCVFTKCPRWSLSWDFGTHWKRTVKTGEETENWSRTLKRRAGNFNLLWQQWGNNYNQKDHEIHSLS